MKTKNELNEIKNELEDLREAFSKLLPEEIEYVTENGTYGATSGLYIVDEHSKED